MASDAAFSLKTNMRKLWADHVIWTRLYIIAAVEGAPLSERLTSIASGVVAKVGTAIGGAVSLAGPGDAAAIRLLRNQEHLGNAIVPYYGQEAGNGLTSLLKQHILIAVNLIEAARSGDNSKFKKEDEKWTNNAQEIAMFLSSANPNWPQKDVFDLLSLHLNLTKGEVVARLNKKWADDVQAFDDIFTEIMTVSDTLSEGIIQQFPDRF